MNSSDSAPKSQTEPSIGLPWGIIAALLVAFFTIAVIGITVKSNNANGQTSAVGVGK